MLATQAGGENTFEVDAPTVGDALRALPIRDLLFDEGGNLRGLVNVYVDRQDMRIRDGLETPAPGRRRAPDRRRHRRRMSRIELADGVSLHVEELGDGLPLIVLHGGPGLDHTMFRPYLDPLAEDVRLIYVDERGQGRSDRVDATTLSLESSPATSIRSPTPSGSIASRCWATPSARSWRRSTRSSSERPSATSSPAAATPTRP